MVFQATCIYVYVADTCEHEWQGEERLRDLLAIQVIIELNVAFCERHLVNCPPSDQLQKECTYVSVGFLIVLVTFNLLLSCPMVVEQGEKTLLS